MAQRLYPDGGIWDYPVGVQFHESGLGTDQFQPLDGGLAVAFLWEDGEIFVPEPSESQESSWGAAVNGAGLVVGQRFVGGANAGAVFWGTETATLPRRRGSSADLRDVNETGLAVGQERGNRGEWAIIWYRGTTWYVDDLADADVLSNRFNAYRLTEATSPSGSCVSHCPASTEYHRFLKYNNPCAGLLYAPWNPNGSPPSPESPSQPATVLSSERPGSTESVGPTRRRLRVLLTAINRT